MTIKQQKEVEPKKAWKAPKLIIHGDLEKITKEAPIPGPNFGQTFGNSSL